MTADPQMIERLVAYFEVRDRQRVEEVNRVLGLMTAREQRLVREAAVMGYVRGSMAGRAGIDTIPGDAAVLAEVVDACLAFDDLYPVINAIAAPEGATP